MEYGKIWDELQKELVEYEETERTKSGTMLEKYDSIYGKMYPLNKMDNKQQIEVLKDYLFLEVYRREVEKGSNTAINKMFDVEQLFKAMLHYGLHKFFDQTQIHQKVLAMQPTHV